MMDSLRCRRRDDVSPEDPLGAPPVLPSLTANSSSYWKPQDILEAVIAHTSTIQTPHLEWQEFPLAVDEWDTLHGLLEKHEESGVRLRYDQEGRIQKATY
jgi:YD repeat-containing protein